LVLTHKVKNWRFALSVPPYTSCKKN